MWDFQGRGKPCPYMLATRGRKRGAGSGVSEYQLFQLFQLFQVYDIYVG
jgi:hypothetical protein